MAFFNFISLIFSNLLFFALHVFNQNSFPKPLSPEDEIKYLKLLKSGCKPAKDKLVRHNLRLVAHIIKKYHFSKNEEDDLISIGTIGLIKAIDSYDLNKGIKLSSYASRCIENEILMHLRSTKKFSTNISINEPIETDKGGNVLTLLDTLSCKDVLFDKIDTKINMQKLKKDIFPNLSQREREVLKMRYGLDGNKCYPQREIAKKLGISRSYVSRIEKKVLSNLRKYFK